MMYLKTKWFGTFLYDDEKIIDTKLFPKNADEIALRLYKIFNDEILSEETQFSKFDPIVDEPRLKKLGKFGKVKKLAVNHMDYGYSLSLLKEACIKVTERRVREEEEKRENRISQAINALDEIIKVENIIMERLTDWYGFFDKFSIEKAMNPKIGENEIDKMEENAIKKLADIATRLKKAREDIEKYIEKAMEEIAPNVTKIAGYKIASRLLAAAGGLQKLAKMPAGTIQLLGAERALFRHLKEGSKPPKHGYLFLHEFVRKAPRNKRGKVARLLATKIAMAAKADAYTRKNIADDLLREIKKRYDEIIGGK